MDESYFKAFDYCLNIAKIIGLYQNGEQSRRYLILGHSSWIASIGFIIVGFLYNLLQFETVIKFVNDLMVALAGLLSFIKLFNFFLRLKSIKELRLQLQELRELSADPRFKNKRFVEK
jgi:hypothetical protein